MRMLRTRLQVVAYWKENKWLDLTLAPLAQISLNVIPQDQTTMITVFLSIPCKERELGADLTARIRLDYAAKRDDVMIYFALEKVIPPSELEDALRGYASGITTASTGDAARSNNRNWKG